MSWRYRLNAMRLVGAAAAYFAVVFGIGFILGPIRVLWLEPRVGARMAELIEAPFMLCAVVLAGRWVGHRLCAAFTPGARLQVGLLAGAFVLAADLALGVGLRGMSVTAVLAGRDLLTRSVYYALVALTAVAPWLFGRARGAGAPARD